MSDHERRVRITMYVEVENLDGDSHQPLPDQPRQPFKLGDQKYIPKDYPDLVLPILAKHMVDDITALARTEIDRRWGQ